MKIVFIVHNYPPVVDGVGDHTFFQVQALRKLGHKVHVICPAKKEIVEQKHPDTYPIIEKWNSKGYNKALLQTKNLQPDQVIIPYVPYAFNKWGVPVELPFLVYKLRKSGLNVCVNFHEVKIRYTWTSKKSYPIGFIQRLIAYGICYNAERFVTSIEFYRDYLLKYTSKPIAVIPVPPNFDTEISSSEDEVNILRNSIAPRKEKIVATYGVRDANIIVAMFSRVLKELPQTKLLFCGKPKQADVLKELDSNVFITGYLTQKEVLTYLKTADVFYLPDPVDNKGRGGSCNKSGSLAAALVTGLPVVGTRGDLNNQLLLQSKQVILTEGNNPEIAAQEVAVLLKSDRRIVENERDDWNHLLSWDTITKDLILFLQSSI
ncbi:MAG: glycosyltransferase family 4 protein [Chitinophagaceae bacterium]